MNTLYYGDCLTIMREKMSPNSVDLVYLDPPFNSKRDYNSIYKDHTGRPLPDQVEAYTDTWFLDADKMRVIRALPKLLRQHDVDGHSADFLAGFISGLVNVQPDMAAYLAYMTERLLWIKWTMKPTASIYLHCDPTASHYLKVMMDVVFGRKYFRSEVIWKRTSARSDAKRWGNVHDSLLYFANSKKVLWNPTYTEYDADAIEKRFRYADPDGRRWASGDVTAKGLSGGGYTYEYKGVSSYWRVPLTKMTQLDEENRLHITRNGGIRIKRYLDELPGLPAQDVITDIYPVSSQGKERLDYATQKPLALLDRIIRASSNEGDVVFDPFCGCATTIEAAERLGRKWVGCDITIHAIRRVARRRLGERLHLIEGEDYFIDGVPKNWEGAHELWKQDPYQFQKWCVELVEGFVNVKKTADDGIDGRIYFDMPGEKVFQSMALEVKGGENLSINSVRALNSVLQFENIQMAGLIALNAPGAYANAQLPADDGVGGTRQNRREGIPQDTNADGG